MINSRDNKQMMFFAHTGLTLGTATLLAGAANVRQGYTHSIASWFQTLGEYADIRVLLVGSLLPDIIDKPIGVFLFRDTFSSGRIFAHTLLFLLLLAVPGYFLYRRRHRTWLLVLAFGTLLHLIFDEIWLSPRTLFWPALGLDFDRVEELDLYLLWVRDLFTKPGLYVPELIGLGILVGFAAVLIHRKRLWLFICRGKG